MGKPTVAIIGAGAGGIAMGVRLRRAGYDYTPTPNWPTGANSWSQAAASSTEHTAVRSLISASQRLRPCPHG